MDVDLRDLELLDALGRHETLTRAAEFLYVSQPALSQRLLRLEERLGVPLFERRGRRLVANAAGTRLLRAARVVLHELGEAEHDVQGLAARRDGPVRLASQCPTNYEWLPPVVRAFRRRLPTAEVRIEPVPGHEAAAALLDGRVDLVLVNKLDAQLDRVRLHRLFDDELVAVVAASHPWAGRHHVDADDFTGVHLILFETYDQDRVPAVPLPLPAGARPTRLTTIPVGSELLVELIRTGDAVTVLPSWSAGPYVAHRDVVAVPVGADGHARTWYAATRHGPGPVPVETFLDVLGAHLDGHRPHLAAVAAT